jgi:CubicO group peptidase (beta-lactamase class C family)
LPKLSKIEFEPGEHTAYTNFGYMVLGAVIEKVTGKAYEDYIRQNILGPLGMKHTDFIYTKEMEPIEAAGSHPLFNIYTPIVPFVKGAVVRETFKKHIWFKRIYTDQTPSTGLIGSPTDAARLVIAYFNMGELDGQRILSEQSVNTMTNESHIKANYEIKNPKNYSRQGISWYVYKNSKGKLVLQHDGGGLGFYTIMTLYPEDKLGFILFANDVTCKGMNIINLAATLDW